MSAEPGSARARERERRMYAALSGINRAIIRATDPQALLDDACRVLVELGGLAGVRVDRREDSGALSAVSAGGAAGDPGAAAVSLAVGGGGFTGTLTATAAEADFFDDAVLALMTEIADDISFGLRSLHETAENERAARQLAVHALVFDRSSEAMVITDADNNIFMVNQAFTDLTGYTLDEVRGRNPRLLQSGRQDQDFYRQMWSALLETGSWKGELWNRRKNGEIFPEWATFNVVRDEGGRIVNHFAVFSDLTQHKAQEELQRLQRFDALTGLPNRIVLQDRVHEAIGHARQHERYVALLYLNLDNFRYVNETLGHVAGDEALCTVAQRFADVVADGGTVSRLSGDTFVVMLDDLNDTTPVGRCADALLQAASAPLEVGGTTVLLSACIGIALFPNDGARFDALLQNADAALSKARESSRNSYCFFTPDLNERARRALNVGAELHKALEQGWFVLHYQPQVDTASGRIVAVEALIRMQHPQKGLVRPDEFIAVAEETGMIVPIGAWVIAEACRQLGRWRREGHDRLKMAINLSPLQFSDPHLFATIADALEGAGVDPRLVELEFTEGAVMRNVRSTVAIMKRLKDMGVRLSIDDFGTGYSSLNYLKQFPIDQIKIDLSFVRNVTTDPNDASIVQAIVAMSRALGVTTVAEGVETAAQAGYLRGLHCDDLQGFYLARPGPADEIGRLLGSRQLADRNAPARTLLVVDDEENVLNSLRRLLRGEGYHVLTAGSGAEALELLAGNEVGVVLSDERMAGMNGTELLRRVRTMYPAAVRIVLSGYADVTTIADAINKGEIWKYVTKPWDSDELLALLREAFVRYEEAQKSLSP